MKKGIISLLCLFAFLCGCQKKELRTLDVQGIVPIGYEELQGYLDSDVRFLLYIGRPDCGDCQEFYPILEDYMNEHKDMGIYYLNIKEFRDQSRQENATKEEKEFYENIREELHFDWTPTIHEIAGGEFVRSYQYLDEDYLEIEDRVLQKERRQEFIKEFETFMNDYRKENVS